MSSIFRLIGAGVCSALMFMSAVNNLSSSLASVSVPEEVSSLDSVSLESWNSSFISLSLWVVWIGGDPSVALLNYKSFRDLKMYICVFLGFFTRISTCLISIESP